MNDEVDRLYSLGHIQHLNMWDSWSPTSDDPYGSSLLFNNTNVGNLARTNVHVSGMLSHSGNVVIIRNWYARTSVPTNFSPQISAAWQRFAGSTYLTLREGPRYRWQRSLQELMQMAPPSDDRPWFSPWPIVVPPRQDVHVQRDHFYATANYRDDLRHVLTSAFDVEPNYHVWIHLDGIAINLHEVELDVGALLDHLLNQNRRRLSMEEKIAAWLLRDVGELDDPGQLIAMADGIRTGLHRGEATRIPMPDGSVDVLATADLRGDAANNRVVARAMEPPQKSGFDFNDDSDE